MASRIHFVDKPEIISRVMFPEVCKLIKEIRNSIFVKKVIDEMRIWDADCNEWYAIANANLRIRRSVGCDQITIDSVLAIFADFAVQYQEITIATAKAMLHGNKVALIGELELIHTINKNVCHACYMPTQKCKCLSGMRNSGSTESLYDLNKLCEKDISFVQSPDLYDETGIFSRRPSEENNEVAEAIKRLDPAILGVAQTYKIKKPAGLLEFATRIIKNNPKITEGELVKQLLQSGIK